MSKASPARPLADPGLPPPRSSARHRNTNEGRNGSSASSQNVLSNMIDTFGAYVPESQLRQSPNLPSGRTPLRSARSSFEKYRSRQPRTQEAEPDAVQEPENNVQYVSTKYDPEDITTDEDAAEPPTVPIAKPPSGYSKASRTNSLRYHASREFPPPSYRSPSPSTQSPRGYQSPREVYAKSRRVSSSKNSQRPSLDKRTSGDSQQIPVVTTRIDKGKGRATEPSPARQGSSQSHSSSTIGPDTPERTSSMQANTTRPPKPHRNKSGDQEDVSNSGFVVSKTPKSSTLKTRKERIIIAEDPEDSGKDARFFKTAKSQRPVPPKRKSSKSPRVSRPASEDDTKGRIPVPQNLQKPLPTAPGMQEPLEPGLGITAVRMPGSSNGAKSAEQQISAEHEEETDVMKRIRELKAAKEQREKDRALDGKGANDGDLIRDQTIPLSPSDRRPPETTRAKEQLALAPELEDSSDVTRDKTPKSPRFASSPLAKSSSPAGGGTPLPPGKVSFSNDGFGSLGRSPILSNIDAQLNPQKSPYGSRTGSRAGRPSMGKSPSTHRRRASGNGSLFSTPEGNGSQISIDSVEADILEYLQAPRMHQTVVPPGERRIIAFSEVGDPEGYPVICCVGMGITRHAMTFYDELAASLKLRLITPDRPGVGDSSPCQEGYRVPLRWPDDVNTICSHLGIQEFSLLAHSAGAVFALATALRMTHNLRCKIHLLSSWIPPSQMSQVGLPQETAPAGNLPRGQRLLRILPTAFLKLSNAASLTSTPSLSKKDIEKRNGTPRKSSDKRSRSARPSNVNGTRDASAINSPPVELDDLQPNMDIQNLGPGVLSAPRTPRRSSITGSIRSRNAYGYRDPQERQRAYDARLTAKIWELARLNANPVVDLLICIERTQAIGFRYVDISRPVVMHHGSKDTRVPVENARWVSRTMQRAEVRELPGEGHSLMASAGVMASVLTEIAKEWEDEEARTDRTESDIVPSHSQRV